MDTIIRLLAKFGILPPSLNVQTAVHEEFKFQAIVQNEGFINFMESNGIAIFRPLTLLSLTNLDSLTQTTTLAQIMKNIEQNLYEKLRNLDIEVIKELLQYLESIKNYLLPEK